MKEKQFVCNICQGIYQAEERSIVETCPDCLKAVEIPSPVTLPENNVPTRTSRYRQSSLGTTKRLCKSDCDGQLNSLKNTRRIERIKSSQRKKLKNTSRIEKTKRISAKQVSMVTSRATGRYRLDQVSARQSTFFRRYNDVLLLISTMIIAIGLTIVQLLSFYFGPYLKLPKAARENSIVKLQRSRLPNNLEEIFSLPDEEIDLAAAALLVAKEDYEAIFQQKLDAHKYLKMVDDMAFLLQKRINDDMEPEEVIQVISNYLYTEQRYVTSQNGWDPSNLYLNMILQGKQGYCLGFAQIWLVLAERMRWRGKPLPIYGVLVPFHIFCRWQDENYLRNIETLHVPPIDAQSSLYSLLSNWFTGKDAEKTRKAGRAIPDSFYRSRYQITEQSEKYGFYLKNLPKKAVISCIYSNRAYLQLERRDSLNSKKQRREFLAKAQKDIDNAWRWYGKNINAMRSQIVITGRYKGNNKKALQFLEKLLYIDPTAETLCLLGETNIFLKNYDKALKVFDQAEKAPAFYEDTRLYRTYGRALAYYHWQKYDQALELCREVAEGNTLNVQMLVLRGQIFHKLGKHNEAVGNAMLLEGLLGVDAEHTLNAWGEIYRYQKGWEQARECYQKVLEWNDASSLTALYGMGEYWHNRNNIPMALSFFHKALMYDPNFYQARDRANELQQKWLDKKTYLWMRECNAQAKKIVAVAEIR